MDTRELTSLVRRSQKGETGAMEELLRLSYTPVSYQCRRFLKTGQDAEDMTQEVLLLLYTKLDTLQEPAAFWGWLGRMTANRCKNALTRTQEDLPILEDEEGNSVLDVMENGDRQTVPEEAFDNAETARMIGGIVDALPEAQRACVLLYYYDEMSVKEIAGLLGVSENTVKSRLNYARRAVKENVLDYEKKQGIRLHSLAPLPLLLYYLRMAAEDGTDPVKAAETAHIVMEKGAASTAGSAAAGKAAGKAATHALQGISLKTAGIAAAGLLIIGGAAAGIATLINTDKAQETTEEEIVTEAEENTAETQDGDAPAPEEPAQEEATPEESVSFPRELLASLPYTGDTGQCAMTAAQASAFADALEECSAQSEAAGYQQPAFCRGALFDAGDGIPALFVSWGQDMGYEDSSGYMPNVSRIYCWDGKEAYTACESHPQEEYYFSEDVSNFALTGNGIIMENGRRADGLAIESTRLYTFTGGAIGEAPAHVYEEFACPYRDIPPDTGECMPVIMENGAAEGGYDFGTLSADKWQLYPEYGEEGGRWREDGGWVAAALDGKFLSPEEAAQARGSFAWYGPDWILGQGSRWATDVSHYWAGDWMDAEELAALLKSGGTGTTGDTPAAETSALADVLPGNVSVSMSGNIQRTSLDSHGYDIDVSYEIPVFEETTKGYRKINEYFRALRDEFVDSGEEGPDGIWEILEGHPLEGDSYYYAVTAEVTAHTEKYVSVRQTLYMYLGGVSDSEDTYHNFRTDTGEQLLLTDILDGSEDGIRQMVADAVKEAEPYAEETGAIDDILSRDIRDFAFYISDGRVHIYFTPVEIYGRSLEPPLDVELPAELKAGWQ